MGQALTRVSKRVSEALHSVLDSSPRYRLTLRRLFEQYQADRSLSEQQILQWTGEKLVADATNEEHEIGARFLPLLAQIDLGNFDAHTVTQCIAQAAMQYLEELKLDMNFHVRFLDCAAKGSVEKLRTIQSFVDLNYQNENGSTALMIACHERQKAMVEFLLSQHVNANLQDALGWTALMFVARDGHEELVELLLSEEYDTEIDLTAQNGINALMCAADAGHFRIVQRLMERGADINACTNAGDTALLHACHGGHTNIVHLLLAAGAEVNVSGKHLCSPALLAARFGYYDILAELVQYGADIAAQDDEGRTVCNFEREGQVAAALQRGVIARFNRGIIKPTHGGFAMPAHGHAMWPRRHTNADESQSSSAASPALSSSLPLHQRGHPQQPAQRKVFHGSSSTVSDSPSSISSTMTMNGAGAHAHNHQLISSRSRTPSPSHIPVRPRKGQPARTPSHHPPSHVTAVPVPSSTRSDTSSSRSASQRTPTTFQHPKLADTLTDDALAALEADVDQIMHRLPTQEQSSTPSSAVETSAAVHSIVKAARIDSPVLTNRHDHSRASLSQASLFVPRDTSDNVHRFESEESTATLLKVPRRPTLRDEIDSADVEAESSDEQSSGHASEPGLTDEDVIAPSAARRMRLGLVSRPGDAHSMLETLDAHLAADRTPTSSAAGSAPASPHSQDEVLTRSSSPDAPTATSDAVTSNPAQVQPPASTSTTPPPHILALREAMATAAKEHATELQQQQRQEQQQQQQPEQQEQTQDDVPPGEPPSPAAVDKSAAESPSKPKSDKPTATKPDLPSTVAPSESFSIAESSQAASPLQVAASLPVLSTSPADASAPAPLHPSKRRPARRKKAIVEIGQAPVAPVAAGLFGATPPMAQTFQPNAMVSNQSTPASSPSLLSSLAPSLKSSPSVTASKPSASPSLTAQLLAASSNIASVLKLGATADSVTHREPPPPPRDPVDAWLLSCGFDPAARASLSGYSFTDLQNLDPNDCIDLIGEHAGSTLYAHLKRRAKFLAAESSPTGAEGEADVAPALEHASSWAQAAINGILAEEKAVHSRAHSLDQSTSHGSAASSHSATEHASSASASHALFDGAPTSSPPAAVPTSSLSPRDVLASIDSDEERKSAPVPLVATAMPVFRGSAATLEAVTRAQQQQKGAAKPAASNDFSVLAALQRLNSSMVTSHPIDATFLSVPSSPEPYTSSGASTPDAAAASSIRGASGPSTSSSRSTEPTGYYTQDLINSQRAWLASSLDSLKYRLQGTTKRDEMRKKQPHRTRLRKKASEPTAAAAAPTGSSHAAAGRTTEEGLPPVVLLDSWSQLGESPETHAAIATSAKHKEDKAARFTGFFTAF